jgi:hypothetical protein
VIKAQSKTNVNDSGKTRKNRGFQKNDKKEQNVSTNGQAQVASDVEMNRSRRKRKKEGKS